MAPRRQINHRGVGGTPHAIADFDGNGLDDVAQLHPSEFYILRGSDGKDLIAMSATWNQVPAKPVYFGVPVAGDFEQPGKPSVLFTGRSMTGLVRPDGKLVWWDALDKSAQHYAVGDFDGDRKLEVVGLGYDDGIRCYDAATGQIKWRMAMPWTGVVRGVISGDINSDGRDEVVLTVADRLVCIGDKQDGTQGQVLWELKMPSLLGSPAIVDLGDRQGGSILVQGEDGYVYCVR